MTVNETLIVCKVLQENGYGDEVSITDEVSFNEFTQHYKIIDQHGEIYVVEERTMEGSN